MVNGSIRNYENIFSHSLEWEVRSGCNRKEMRKQNVPFRLVYGSLLCRKACGRELLVRKSGIHCGTVSCRKCSNHCEFCNSVVGHIIRDAVECMSG